MRKNDVDPWCKLPVETINIDGVKVNVRSLSVGELNALRTTKKSEIEASIAVVAICCERQDGIEITDESTKRLPLRVFKLLNDAVSRVNGWDSLGNSNATAGDSSSSE